MRKLEKDLQNEVKRQQDLKDQIVFLERNEQLSKETFREKIKEMEEIIGIKDRDLEIERKQRHRAEQRVTELELRLMKLEREKREIENGGERMS